MESGSKYICIQNTVLNTNTFWASITINIQCPWQCWLSPSQLIVLKCTCKASGAAATLFSLGLDPFSTLPASCFLLPPSLTVTRPPHPTAKLLCTISSQLAVGFGLDRSAWCWPLLQQYWAEEKKNVPVKFPISRPIVTECDGGGGIVA